MPEPTHDPTTGVLTAAGLLFVAGFLVGLGWVWSAWWLAAGIPLTVVAGYGLVQDFRRARRG